MKCKKCHNQDQRYFFYLNKYLICRKCLVFSAGLNEKKAISFSEAKDAEYEIGFELTLAQKRVSKAVLESLKQREDVLIYAACGTGKTEIVLQTIAYCLENNLKVAIAIPRRQVVIELKARMEKYFKNIKVICVCEGFKDEIYADLIICTTHQLYNYYNYFDCLILDEPDAFPFANNPLLQALAKNSVKGNSIYMTATPSEKLKKLKTLKLFKRYHGYDLLVPKVVIGFEVQLLIKMFYFLKKYDRVLLFVPTIKLANKMSKILRYPVIHSKLDNKEKIIEDFDKGLHSTLITTTIMERGITIEGVNICVLFADHPVFNKASLIQIAGRVGRKITKPDGYGIFLCRRKSEKVDLCVKELEMMNASSAISL